MYNLIMEINRNTTMENANMKNKRTLASEYLRYAKLFSEYGKLWNEGDKTAKAKCRHAEARCNMLSSIKYWNISL